MCVKNITLYAILFLISININSYANNLQDSTSSSQDLILTDHSIEDSLGLTAHARSAEYRIKK